MDIMLVVAFFLVARIREECVVVHYLPVLFFQRWRSASAHQFHSLHWDRSTESGTWTSYHPQEQTWPPYYIYVSYNNDLYINQMNTSTVLTTQNALGINHRHLTAPYQPVEHDYHKITSAKEPLYQSFIWTCSHINHINRTTILIPF